MDGGTLCLDGMDENDFHEDQIDHPFGAIKHYADGRHFLYRGKEKVTAEFVLSALSYNIRRAIALCGGVQKLIECYRSIAIPKIRKIAEI